MIAKPVVKNKFWVVKDDAGEQVATIQKLINSKEVMLVSDEGRTAYPSIKVLGQKHNIKIGRAIATPTVEEGKVYGYLADGDTFNTVFNVKQNLSG